MRVLHASRFQLQATPDYLSMVGNVELLAVNEVRIFSEKLRCRFTMLAHCVTGRSFCGPGHSNRWR